ncbi:MAG: Ig-like domain-containing protein [Gemmatimonadota bacterium]|nr:MAG: Ig-like domain-containing protein [Gemmatimonadota bacterium]
MTRRYAFLTVALFCAIQVVSPATVTAQGPQGREPFTLSQLVQMVESGAFTHQRIIFVVREACLAFRWSENAASRLRAAGATEALIADLSGQCVRLPQEVEIVTVRPTELEISVEETAIIRAQALAADSTPIPNVDFEWSVDDTLIAEVSHGGVVKGLATGATWVRARSAQGPVGMVWVRVSEALARETEVDSLAAGVAGGKSAGTAAALGVLVPGGGEFYAGNTAKGVVVLVGAAAGLAAGYFITSEEITDQSFSPTGSASCDPTGSPCTFPASRTDTIETTRNIAIGAAVAGAFWLYGLIDGIRSAKSARPSSSSAPLEEENEPGEQGGVDSSTSLRIEILPADGLRVTADGELELSVIRIKS